MYRNKEIHSTCSIISISIYHKLVLTSLTAWLFERSYIYGWNKILNIRFLFPCMSIHFLSTHILVILNLCVCKRKHIFLRGIPQCINIYTYSIISISICHKLVPTSLVALILERSYIYGEIKHLNHFFVFMHVNPFPLNAHLIILNLCICSSKVIFYAAYSIV